MQQSYAAEDNNGLREDKVAAIRWKIILNYSTTQKK